jgi:Putative mono-oxygenase ydhR
MITEIVTFKLPDGMTQEEAAAKFEQTAPRWRANPDLIRKNYLVNAKSGVGGGVYLWKDKAHAEKWHGEEFRKRVKETYGSEPTIQFFDTPVVVDNLAGEIVKG